MLNVARPNLILKQCEGIPGYPIFLGEFEYEPIFKFNITFDTAFYQFPGKSTESLQKSTVGFKSINNSDYHNFVSIVSSSVVQRIHSYNIRISRCRSK